MICSNDLKEILSTDLFDHLPIFTIKRDKYKKKIRQFTPKKQNKTLIEKLSNESWFEVNLAGDVSAVYNLFQNKLNELYSKSFPMKTAANKENLSYNISRG